MSAIESITPEENRAPERCLVLDGESETFLAAQLRRMLEACGFSVLRASNAEEALRLCWRETPRAIFLPRRSRGGETAAILRRIRRMPRAGARAVIVYGGGGDPAEISRMIWEGASDCIAQPVSPEILDAKLKQAGVAGDL